MLPVLLLLATTPALPEPSAPTLATAPEPGLELMVAPSPPVVLATWDEALGRLRTRSVELLLALGQLELTQAQARQALSPLLPSVSGSATVQERLAGGALTLEGGGGQVPVGEDPDDPQPTSPLITLRATATQSVVDVPAWYRLSAARARERAAQASAQDTWRIALRELSRSLVALVAAERAVEINRGAYALSQARHTLAQESEQLGVGRKLDTLRTTRDLEITRAELLSSVESLRRAREGLGLALGAGGEVGLAPSFRMEGLRDSLAALCKPLWGAPRSDLRAAREQVQAAERTVGASRTEYAPTLGVQSTLTAITVTPGLARVNSWNIAAVLELPFWDGGARGATVRAERANLTLAEQRLESVLRALELELSQARRGVALAEALRQAAERSREAAALTDSLTQEAFREGVGTSLELVQSAVELREAERTLALRELDLVQARVEALMVEATCAL
ncbi:MAG TPA: TolC family protein [Myxococcaceae bacterium]|jgi:outer membrane protein TolC